MDIRSDLLAHRKKKRIRSKVPRNLQTIPPVRPYYNGGVNRSPAESRAKVDGINRALNQLGRNR